MVNVYLNLSIFTVFLKSKNIIFKIRRAKVTDYAALTLTTLCMSHNVSRFFVIQNEFFQE